MPKDVAGNRDGVLCRGAVEQYRNAISEACNQAPHVKDILTVCCGEGGAQIAME